MNDEVSTFMGPSTVSLDEINALTNIHFYRDPYKKIRLYEKTYQSTD